LFYYRYDGNILDFTKGPLTEKIMSMANNCFVKERKDRITFFSLKLSMVCPGSFMGKRELDFYMIMNKKKSVLTCDRCSYAMLGKGKLCSVNSFLLPKHFHHKKANFKSLLALMNARGFIRLPVPDPLTLSYLMFRY
jgi:hypothetical protein